MSETQADRGQPVGTGTRAAGAVHIRRDYTPAGAARQLPAWAASKAAADRSWPGVRTLLQSLGFSDPRPTRRELDLQGVDVICSDGRRLAWRCRSRRYLSFQDCTFRRSRPNGTPTECAKWGSADFALWTWVDASGAVCDWLLLDAGRVAPLLSAPWHVTRMCDADFVSVPWSALAQAGAVVMASRNVKAALN